MCRSTLWLIEHAPQRHLSAEDFVPHRLRHIPQVEPHDAELHDALLFRFNQHNLAAVDVAILAPVENLHVTPGTGSTLPS